VNIPPAAVPVSPGFPPPSGIRGGALPPPSDPLLGGSQFGPPSTGGKELVLPESLPGNGSARGQAPSGSGFLGEPTNPQQSKEPPLAKPELAAPNGAAPKSPLQATRYPGLADLVVVKSGVASGRKPTAEGLDLLKKSGYRTVAYLHGTDADTAALQAEVEKRGLVFVAIETTPAKFAAAMDAFNRVVATPAGRPVYICDDDGIRTGVLWYAHFRTVEILNADAANVRARPLGFVEDGELRTTFEVALQQYLSTR
jgi:hypothetical protein